jgi:hypothetical protein
MVPVRDGCEETSGLCDAFKQRPEFDLICPMPSDIQELENAGFSTLCWASDLPPYSENRFYTYTPLRQNLVLLLACITGEL